MEGQGSFPLVVELIARSGFEKEAAKLMMASSQTYHDSSLLDLTIKTQFIYGRTRLHTASACGNISRLREILYKTSINGVSSLRKHVAEALEMEDLSWLGETALFLAVEGAHNHVAGMLVGAGADPGRVLEYPRNLLTNPFGLAARNSHREGGLELFQLLLTAMQQRCAAGSYGVGAAVFRTHLALALWDACTKSPDGTDAAGLERKLQCVMTLLGELHSLGALDSEFISVVATSDLVGPLEMVLSHATLVASRPNARDRCALSAVARLSDLSYLAALLARYKSLVASSGSEVHGVAFTQEAFDRELRHAIEAVCEQRY